MLEFNISHGVLVGGAYPDHLITLSDLEKENLEKTIIDYTSGSKKIKLAKEIKAVAITIQQAGPQQRKTYIICGRPQGLNEDSQFNEYFCETLLQYLSERNPLVNFLNACVDGVACDTTFVINVLNDFLSGKKSYLANKHANHVAKAIRNQFVTGTYVISLGTMSIFG
eukprot:Awhi_evm1s11903